VVLTSLLLLAGCDETQRMGFEAVRRLFPCNSYKEYL